MPWDLDRLTVEQFDAYCAAVRDIERQAKKSGG